MNITFARTTPVHRIALGACAAAVVMLAGCNRQQDTTVGQKVDQGLATAEQKTDQMASAAGEKIDQAKTAIERSADKAGDATADASVTAKVKTALLTAPDLKSLKIDVDTQAGVVTLKGEVKSSQEKTQAEEVAQNVTGVQSVINDLRIAG